MKIVPCQVIKPLPAFFATAAAAFLLPVFFAALVDFIRCTVRAMHSVAPTFLSNVFLTFVFVYEVVEAAEDRVKLELYPILKTQYEP